MQYILSQEEYDNLVSKQKNHIKMKKDKLQKLCTHICDTMPANVGWKGVDKPWGCVLTSKNEWYCDKCPVEEICPNDFKEYSK